MEVLRAFLLQTVVCAMCQIQRQRQHFQSLRRKRLVYLLSSQYTVKEVYEGRPEKKCPQTADISTIQVHGLQMGLSGQSPLCDMPTVL